MSQPVVSSGTANGTISLGGPGTAEAAVQGSPAATTPPPAQGAGQGDAKSYTQAEINALVQNRLDRERQKFADYDELKAKAGQYDEALEAAKTDQQKAVDAARREGEKSATERWQGLLVNAEVRAQAAALKFHDPSDAVVQMTHNLAGVKVGNDGAVDGDSIKKALEQLAKDKPYLVADERNPRPQGDAGQGPRGGSGPTDMNSLIRGLGKR